mgnify:CR=1 FL=1
MINKVWNEAKKFIYILDRQQKMWGCVVFFLSFIGALAETLGVSVILPLVQVMIDPDALFENKYIAKIADVFHIENGTELMILIVIGVILVYALKNIFLLFLTYVRTKYSCKIQRELSVKMMKYYMKRGYLFFVQHNTSELVRGISTTPTNTYQVLFYVLKLLAELFTVISICFFIMLTDIRMAAIMAVLIVLCLFIVIFGFKNMMRKFGKKYHDFYLKVSKSAYQAFQGIKEVLVMNRQEYFVKEYEDAYVQQQKASIGKTIATESPAYFIEVVCIAGLLTAVCIQSMGTEDIGSMIPKLAAFAVGAFRILPSLGRISSAVNNIIFYVPAIQDMYDNFKEVEEHEKEEEEKLDEDAEEQLDFRHEVVLKGIDWKYPNTDKYILKDINMTIHKGESVAFVGTSGAGKTTLADILLGLLIPEKGDILVDGKSVLRSKGKWGRMIGFVSQAFYLNDDTIRNNVAFGIPARKIKDEMVWKALEQAQLKETVEKLPKGLDTVVGERGLRFSGGQRQRLAIARALYYNPEILILDEATSALDTETESAVMESIEALQGHKTLVIIAHRLSTIRNCDTVYEIGDTKAVKK